MVNMKIFLEALREETFKVFTAFATWGLGVTFMLVYCFFVLWLNNNFGIYATIGGALVFLTIAFFFIDLWWNYNRYKHNCEMKKI